MTTDLPPGLYDRLIDTAVATALEAAGERAARTEPEAADLPLYLARHLRDAVAAMLAALGDEAPSRGPRLVNHLLGEARRHLETALAEAVHDVVEPPSVLTEVRRPHLALVHAPPATPRPETPLAQSALLVNGRGEPSAGSELARELASADSVDVLVSFIRWTGFVHVRDALADCIERGVRVRVLTTVYMGASEAAAIEALSRLGATVRVSFDVRSTRMHAKAWLFHRDSGFTTALVGSSNLSDAALNSGLEWNVRVSSVDAPAVIDKFRATFESYWDDERFAPFDASDETHCARLREALMASRLPDAPLVMSGLEVRPWPHQVEILEALTVERERHGRTRNLLVSATGTGKTVVAALDYRRLCRAAGRSLTLLFVAHRKEILEQARTAFRTVLADSTFGELLVDQERPREGRHVFASVQSLARVALDAIRRDAFEVLIVDEFHHAAAGTYQRVLQHFTPRQLLGMTATPERSDGESVLGPFDGRIAFSLRLWDALERGLLVPFQYFGIHDNTDLRHVTWRRGGYDTSELEQLYTGNDARVHLVLRALQERVAAPSSMRALGFCVSIAHARYMAARFSEAGLHSVAVTGTTSRDDRRHAIRALQTGELQALFTVDVFNEGVDIPSIDTILMLRPTESAVLFQQQLGRGLRRAEGKSALTVLDFIGQHRRSYRFDLRLRELAGGTRRGLVEQLERGFPYLPPGCSLQLDRVASRIVVENLRSALDNSLPNLVRELRTLPPSTTLAGFLHHTLLEPEALYSSRRSWLELRAAAFDEPRDGVDQLEGAAHRFGRLLAIEDAERIELLRTLARTPEQLPPSSVRHRRLTIMIGELLWPGLPLAGLRDRIAAIARCPVARAELAELAALLDDRARHLTPPWQPEGDIPLALWGRYARAEVMAAFDLFNKSGAVMKSQAGVLYAETHHTDLLFVTLRKTEKHYSPATMYRDYPISRTRFHWESQHTAHRRSRAGARYLDGSSTVLLFVREARHDERGETMAFTFLGPVHLESVRGDRPMQIVWRLEHEAPVWWFKQSRVVA